jgi:hypothetical protein
VRLYLPSLDEVCKSIELLGAAGVSVRASGIIYHDGAHYGVITLGNIGEVPLAIEALANAGIVATAS